MLICVSTKTTVDRMGRTWNAIFGKFQCDTCQIEFEKKTNHVILKRPTHYCSMTCFRLGNRKHGATDLARKKTCLERYGVEHPMIDPTSDYRRKRDKTMLKRYGHTIPTKSDVVKTKTQRTCQERYGVPFPMMNESIKARMVESLKQNDLQAIAIKRIDTMKRNNSFKKSRAEDKMYALLVEQFGNDDVERNKRPEGTAWPIDFYVKSIDTWIQVDGVYWHGLDGQLEKHRERSRLDKRSRIIVYKWETDRRQEFWFAERGMKLARFTDKETLRMSTVPF